MKQSLLFHGINLRPARMTPLANILKDLGYVPTIGHFRGHKESLLAFTKVNLETWSADFERYYSQIAADEKVLVGFSIGAGLPNYLSLKNKKRYFTKQILFSPAFELTRTASIIRRFLKLPKKILVPSLNSIEYKVHWFTPMAAYRVLINVVDGIKSFSDKSILNIPTLVFADPCDRLTDTAALERFIKDSNLTNWKLVKVDSSRGRIKGTQGHLIIDEPSLGTSEWNRVVKEIENFVK